MGGHHHHDHQHHGLEQAFASGDGRYAAAWRVTVVGAVVNLVLSVIKVAVGWLGNSQALIADGIHSLSDLASDALVVWASKHGSKDADEEHPYGHGRIETLATVALGAILIIVALGILWDAVSRLFEPATLLRPEWLALVVAALSVVSKEALYHYTMAVARRLRSALLKANAWHHRSDAISSIVVLVGVAGAMAGLTYLDAIAAAVVALMVAKIGWDLAWNAVHELIDTALEEERVAAIRDTILAVDGVSDVHLLRTRSMGPDALVDVHILLDDPRMSVSEGHQISETVRARLIREIEEVSDVTVHIDPEDDEKGSSCQYLPLRNVIMARVEPRLREIPEYGEVRETRLHYLDGHVHMELFMSCSAAGSAEAVAALEKRFSAAVEGVEAMGGVKVYFG